MESLVAPLVNHLWQSTLFALVVAAACFALRANHPRTRYWLWLAASLKFLLPFSLLMSIGARPQKVLGPPPMPAIAVEQISTSFAPVDPGPVPRKSRLQQIAFAFWAAGSLTLLARWTRRWNTIHRAARRGTPTPIRWIAPVVTSPHAVEPGVFGILRPVLLIPDGIFRRLTPEQFDAILHHEQSHILYRDNLTAALHMLVEALFWFHPAVWLIGARLVEERERACDESVIQSGKAPHVYAEGILNVCKHYLESPLPCASGVSGSDLKRRIKEIMTERLSQRLTFARKLALATVAAAALTTPMIIGFLRAQTLPPPPEHTYDVVSIRPAQGDGTQVRIGPGPQGGLRTENTGIMQLLTFAYDLREYQFENVPGWVRSARYDVQFTPDKPEPRLGPGMSRDVMEGVFNRQRQRMQAVLRDRFGLVLRAETRELPVYALTVAKGGHKLVKPEGNAQGPHVRMSRSELSASGGYLNMLTNSLSNLLGRTVINETGLDGPFDFKLTWTPDASIAMPGPPGRPPEPVADTGAPNIFTAVTEQLGLKLESKKGPVKVFVIEKIEKPTEN